MDEEIKLINERLELLTAWVIDAIPNGDTYTSGQAARAVGVHPKVINKAIEMRLLKGLQMYGSERFLRSTVISLKDRLHELQQSMTDEIWPGK